MAKVAEKKTYANEEELRNDVFRRARCILKIRKYPNSEHCPLCTNALRNARSLSLTDDEVASIAREVASDTQFYD